MELSISNIAWTQENDTTVYNLMKKYGYTGLEIAPTRIFPEAPYSKTVQARSWSRNLYEKYGFVISSMQSIWFGIQEKLFGSNEEREILMDYTKKAINFAEVTGCHNIVFGCPRNRFLPEGTDPYIADSFFKELGEYALLHGTIIGMEANPVIYNTNYINSTENALALIKRVNSKGFLLNLDLGTIIQNNENIDILKGQVKYINHVHISEPGIKVIERREIHKRLKDLLKKEGYNGFISVEMGKTENISVIEDVLKYVKEI